MRCLHLFKLPCIRLLCCLFWCTATILLRHTFLHQLTNGILEGMLLELNVSYIFFLEMLLQKLGPTPPQKYNNIYDKFGQSWAIPSHAIFHNDFALTCHTHHSNKLSKSKHMLFCCLQLFQPTFVL